MNSAGKTVVERINAKRGICLNKLQAYKVFKTEYKVEEYVLKMKAVNQRSAMSRFGCGVAPIILEIGRFLKYQLMKGFVISVPTRSKMSLLSY